jgi:hypothetical protein
MTRGVVVTVAAKFEATFWVTFIVDGTEQLEPVSAKLHAIVATPLNPAPPMERLYEAVPPAETVFELEPPVPMARPKPCRFTICVKGADVAEAKY